MYGVDNPALRKKDTETSEILKHHPGSLFSPKRKVFKFDGSSRTQKHPDYITFIVKLNIKGKRVGANCSNGVCEGFIQY